jgi:hypothetical protein
VGSWTAVRDHRPGRQLPGYRPPTTGGRPRRAAARVQRRHGGSGQSPCGAAGRATTPRRPTRRVETPRGSGDVDDVQRVRDRHASDCHPPHRPLRVPLSSADREVHEVEHPDADAPESLSWAALPKVLLAGTAVGLMTGFFGVGGGFVIVPALVLTMGFSMPDAVGTSLVVIAINSAMALGLRAGTLDIHWGDALPFLVLAIIGTVLGKRIADRVPASKLTTGFVALLIALAAYTAISSISQLV